MPGPQDFFFGVLVPALVCGLVLALAWLRRGATAGGTRGRIAGAWAVGLGVLAAHAYLFGAPVMPEAGRVLAARDWIPWVVAGGILLASLEAVPALRRLLAAAAGPLLLATITWLSLQRQAGAGISWIELAAVVLGLVLAWTSAEALARRVPGAAMPLVLWVVAVATSLAALFAHSASIAQIAGALAGTLGAAVVVAWWNPRLSLAGGGVAIALVVVAACLVNAVYFATLPRAAAVLLLLSLGVPWLALLPWFDALGPRSKAVVRAVCALVPASAAVLLAVLGAPESEY